MNNLRNRRAFTCHILYALSALSVASAGCLAYMEYQQAQLLKTVYMLPKDESSIDIIALVQDVGEQNVDLPALREWVKNRWGMYQIDDYELVNTILELCPDIKTDDVEKYKEYMSSCTENNLVVQLREAAKNQQGIFQPDNQLANVSLPPLNYQPDNGFAYTCFGSRWDGRKLLLYSTEQESPLSIVAKGAYSCPLHLKYPDMQLNQAQFDFLFSEFKYPQQTVYVLEQ